MVAKRVAGARRATSASALTRLARSVQPTTRRPARARPAAIALAAVRIRRGLGRGHARLYPFFLTQRQSGQHHRGPGPRVARAVGQPEQVRAKHLDFEALAHVVEELAFFTRLSRYREGRACG